MTCCFARHLARRQRAKFLINQGEQFLAGLGVTSLNSFRGRVISIMFGPLGIRRSGLRSVQSFRDLHNYPPQSGLAMGVEPGRFGLIEEKAVRADINFILVPQQHRTRDSGAV
jgi:hypothetical protein